MATDAVELTPSASPEPTDEVIEHLVPRFNNTVLELSRHHSPSNEFLSELDLPGGAEAVVTVHDGVFRIDYGLYKIVDPSIKRTSLDVGLLAAKDPINGRYTTKLLEDLVMFPHGSQQWAHNDLYYPADGSALAFNICYSSSGYFEVRNRLITEGSIYVVTGTKKSRSERHLKVVPPYTSD